MDAKTSKVGQPTIVELHHIREQAFAALEPLPWYAYDAPSEETVVTMGLAAQLSGNPMVADRFVSSVSDNTRRILDTYQIMYHHGSPIAKESALEMLGTLKQSEQPDVIAHWLHRALYAPEQAFDYIVHEADLPPDKRVNELCSLADTLFYAARTDDDMHLMHQTLQQVAVQLSAFTPGSFEHQSAVHYQKIAEEQYVAVCHRLHPTEETAKAVDALESLSVRALSYLGTIEQALDEHQEAPASTVQKLIQIVDTKVGWIPQVEHARILNTYLRLGLLDKATELAASPNAEGLSEEDICWSALAVAMHPDRPENAGGKVITIPRGPDEDHERGKPAFPTIDVCLQTGERGNFDAVDKVLERIYQPGRSYQTRVQGELIWDKAYHPDQLRVYQIMAQLYAENGDATKTLQVSRLAEVFAARTAQSLTHNYSAAHTERMTEIYLGIAHIQNEDFEKALRLGSQAKGRHRSRYFASILPYMAKKDPDLFLKPTLALIDERVAQKERRAEAYGQLVDFVPDAKHAEIVSHLVAKPSRLAAEFIVKSIAQQLVSSSLRTGQYAAALSFAQCMPDERRKRPHRGLKAALFDVVAHTELAIGNAKSKHRIKHSRKKDWRAKQFVVL